MAKGQMRSNKETKKPKKEKTKPSVAATSAVTRALDSKGGKAKPKG